MRLAHRLIGEVRLASFAELWETIVRREGRRARAQPRSQSSDPRHVRTARSPRDLPATGAPKRRGPTSDLPQSGGSTMSGPEILHHHRHLLPQRRAAYRPRLRGDRHRRHRALQAAGRQGRVLPDRHRRARLKMKQTAAKEGIAAARAGRPQLAALPRAWRGARHLQRRLHPHDRAAALPLVARRSGGA